MKSEHDELGGARDGGGGGGFLDRLEGNSGAGAFCIPLPAEPRTAQSGDLRLDTLGL